MFVVHVGQGFCIAVDCRRGIRSRHGGVRSLVYSFDGQRFTPASPVLVVRGCRPVPQAGSLAELLDARLVRVMPAGLPHCCILFRDTDDTSGTMYYRLGLLHVSPSGSVVSQRKLQFFEADRWQASAAEDTDARFLVGAGPCVWKEKNGTVYSRVDSSWSLLVDRRQGSARSPCLFAPSHLGDELIVRCSPADFFSSVTPDETFAHTSGRLESAAKQISLQSSLYELEMASVRELNGIVDDPQANFNSDKTAREPPSPEAVFCLSLNSRLGSAQASGLGVRRVAIPQAVTETASHIVDMTPFARTGGWLVASTDNQLVAIGGRGNVVMAGVGLPGCVRALSVANCGGGPRQCLIAVVHDRDFGSSDAHTAHESGYACSVWTWPALTPVALNFDLPEDRLFARRLQSQASLPRLLPVTSLSNPFVEQFLVYPRSTTPTGESPINRIFALARTMGVDWCVDYKNEREGGAVEANANAGLAAKRQFCGILETRARQIRREIGELEERIAFKRRLAEALVCQYQKDLRCRQQNVEHSRHSASTVASGFLSSTSALVDGNFDFDELCAAANFSDIIIAKQNAEPGPARKRGRTDADDQQSSFATTDCSSDRDTVGSAVLFDDKSGAMLKGSLGSVRSDETRSLLLSAATRDTDLLATRSRTSLDCTTGSTVTVSEPVHSHSWTDDSASSCPGVAVHRACPAATDGEHNDLDCILGSCAHYQCAFFVATTTGGRDPGAGRTYAFALGSGIQFALHRVPGGESSSPPDPWLRDTNCEQAKSLLVDCYRRDLVSVVTAVELEPDGDPVSSQPNDNARPFVDGIRVGGQGASFCVSALVANGRARVLLFGGYAASQSLLLGRLQGATVLPGQELPPTGLARSLLSRLDQHCRLRSDRLAVQPDWWSDGSLQALRRLKDSYARQLLTVAQFTQAIYKHQLRKGNNSDANGTGHEEQELMQLHQRTLEAVLETEANFRQV